MWRINAAAVLIAAVLAVPRARLYRLRFWLVESVCTHWSVAPLFSALPFDEPCPPAASKPEELRGIGIGQHQESFMLRYDVRLTPKPKGLDSRISL